MATLSKLKEIIQVETQINSGRTILYKFHLDPMTMLLTMYMTDISVHKSVALFTESIETYNDRKKVYDYIRKYGRAGMLTKEEFLDTIPKKK